MKKFFILISLLLLSSPVMAKTIPVQALDEFSTENPPSSMSVKVLEDLNLDDELIFHNGYIINGKIVDVEDPKRLKRNATFTFVPIEYTDLSGQTRSITGYFPAKYTTKLNKGELAKSAALGVGSYFVKGLSLGYSAVEGAIKNEKDNRFKSSVNAVYEDSPFSYVEKGQEIIISKEQVFLLNFKVKDAPEEDEPNYEYKLMDSQQLPDNSQEQPKTDLN